MGGKPQVGFIGVGLMGHGLAKNLALKGYPPIFLNHPGNKPADDIIALGGRPVDSIAGIARAAEVIFLCVTGSPQVEEVVLQPGGLLEGLGGGKIVVDCSTAMPGSTVKVAAAIEATGARYVDSPMTRTPKEAEEGRINVMVGGDEADVARVRPLLETFAENIYYGGPVGSGHTLKLLHNFLAMGNAALVAEAVTTARKAGVDIKTFCQVITTGGGESVVFQRLVPYILDGDDGNFAFSLANGDKDMGYYTEMAGKLGVATTAAKAVHELYSQAMEKGLGSEPVPHLIDMLGGVDSA